MNNSERSQVEAVYHVRAKFPDAHMPPGAVKVCHDFTNLMKKSPEEVIKYLDFMTPVPSVLLNPCLVRDREVMQAREQMLNKLEKRDGKRPADTDRQSWVVAKASVTPLSMNKRNLDSVTLGRTMFDNMDDQVVKRAIFDKVKDGFHARGGPANTFGRIKRNFPRKEDERFYKLINPEELKLAFKHTGVPEYDTLERRHAFTLTHDNEAQRVTINRDSTAGFPTLGSLRDEEVFDINVALSKFVRGKMYGVKTYEAFAEECDRLTRAIPSLFVFEAKCKQDMYKSQALMTQDMRFYAVCSASLRLVMAGGTQALAAMKYNILDAQDYLPLEEYAVTAQGINMASDGAAKLVAVLDAHAYMRGYSYTHNGDDTIIVLYLRDGTVSFSLDCSKFDITQSHKITRPIDMEIARRVGKIDPIAGFMYRRMVCGEKKLVMVGGSTFTTEDMGFSGTPLQSEKNDILMDVLCQRFFSMLFPWGVYNDLIVRTEYPTVFNEYDPETHRMTASINDYTKEVLADIGGVAAASLGLKLKLADFRASPCTTFRESLMYESFQFNGYYLYVGESQQVHMHIDVPRSIAGILYPNTWIFDGRQMRTLEAHRLASTIFGFGLPPPDMARGFVAATMHCVYLLDKAIARGDAEEEAIAPELKASFADLPKSIVGIRRALLTRGGQQFLNTQQEGETDEEFYDFNNHDISRYPDLIPFKCDIMPQREAFRSASAVSPDYYAIVAQSGENLDSIEKLSLTSERMLLDQGRLAREIERDFATYVKAYPASKASFGLRPPVRARKFVPMTKIMGHGTVRKDKKVSKHQGDDNYDYGEDDDEEYENDDDRESFKSNFGSDDGYHSDGSQFSLDNREIAMEHIDQFHNDYWVAEIN